MTVTVSTPSRLHFGLLRFAAKHGPSYGGVGMMVDRPRWTIELAAADEWKVAGRDGERALSIARAVLERVASAAKPRAIDVRIRESIPEHRGLGGGTQLSLAIAAGIRALCELPPGTAAELAALTGRGQRSAIGTHGFEQGGLIWETGSLPGEALGRLAARVVLPEEWRILLLTAPRVAGLSGEQEREAFDVLPPIAEPIVDRLAGLVEGEMLPAARRGDLDAFGEAVFQYGRLAGECFAVVQGGAYASPEIAECVQTIRQIGVRGVGQSSWGPTVFSITGSEEQARELLVALRKDPRWRDYDFEVAAPDNTGAVLTM